MEFWLKIAHISAVALWFTGLFFLPRLLAARDAATGRALFFGVMTPAAGVAVALGAALAALHPHGAWLPAKLLLVSIAVLLHVHAGMLLGDLDTGRVRHGLAWYRVLTWAPLPLVLAIAALSGAKP